MKKWFMCLLVSVILLPVQAKEIKGVTLPDTVTLEQVPLQLNGAGIRTKLLFNVYVIGLYTPHTMQQAEAIVQLNKPRRIWLTLLRKVDANSICASLLDGLKNNLNASEMANFQPQIEQMEKLFKRSGTLQKGDIVTLDLIPTQGLSIKVRDGQQTADITSETFARSVLRIWLGQNPVDKKLKQELTHQATG